MTNASDIAFVVVLFLLIGGIIWGLLEKKNQRIENMDDEDPFDGEWKGGDPNEPVREIAKPIEFDEK